MATSVEDIVAGSPLEEAVQDETAAHAAALFAYERARDLFASKQLLESELEAERAEVKLRIIARLMELGLHYTPAEKQCATEPEYKTHLERQRLTVYDKECARTEAEAALSRAYMAIARLKVLAGVI